MSSEAGTTTGPRFFPWDFITRRRFRTSLQFAYGKHTFAAWIRVGALLGIFAFCVGLFIAVEQPIFNGVSDLRLGADTQTYYAVADAMGSGGKAQAEFLTVTGNLFGPIAMALLFKNAFWIMSCNFALFFLAVLACTPIKGLNKSFLMFLLALNATTLVSMVTLNKEIFTLVASLLLCRLIYAEKKSKLLLLVILFVGMLARWEQPAITLMFLFLWRKNSVFRRHPTYALFLVIGAITVAYPLALHLFDLSAFTEQASNGGAIIALNRIQASFGYPLVLIPKTMMSLFSHLLTPTYWFTQYPLEDFKDLANQYVINLHCLAMLFIFIVAFFKGRLSVSRPLPFFIALYLIVTSANAFLQPRYQYPVYVLLCFDIARREITPMRFRLFMQSRPKPSITAPAPKLQDA